MSPMLRPTAGHEDVGRKTLVPAGTWLAVFPSASLHGMVLKQKVKQEGGEDPRKWQQFVLGLTVH